MGAALQRIEGRLKQDERLRHRPLIQNMVSGVMVYFIDRTIQTTNNDFAEHA